MNKRNFLHGVSVGLLIATVVITIKQHCWSAKRFEKQWVELNRGSNGKDEYNE